MNKVFKMLFVSMVLVSCDFDRYQMIDYGPGAGTAFCHAVAFDAVHLGDNVSEEAPSDVAFLQTSLDLFEYNSTKYLWTLDLTYADSETVTGGEYSYTFSGWHWMKYADPHRYYAKRALKGFSERTVCVDGSCKVYSDNTTKQLDHYSDDHYETTMQQAFVVPETEGEISDFRSRIGTLGSLIEFVKEGDVYRYFIGDDSNVPDYILCLLHPDGTEKVYQFGYAVDDSVFAAPTFVS